MTHLIALTLALLASVVSDARAQNIIPAVPLAVRQTAKPMVMLVASKEHRLFYEAYNDASDIDGDGALDIRFKPSITYLGLFNSNYCYTHNAKSDNSGLFTPTAQANQPLRTCSSSWSGNWLNYVTTSRIDALRVVLYGGMREVDAEQTILRRAYIPQDAHSWAKEYTNQATDGYQIADYTPLTAPDSGKRHFFGNVTPNAAVSCGTLSNCSNIAPVLAVVKNSSKRVWDWASSESPVLRADAALHGGTRADYALRVLACPSGYTDGCKPYGTVYKPIGLLHEYGETDLLLFGLLSGSYDKNMSGGRLRKPVGSFKDEVDSTNGSFTNSATIAKTFDALRIRNYNNGSTGASYRGGALNTSIPTEGQFPDWGNPIGEMMYESLRYFAGRPAGSTAFTGVATVDDQVGLPTPAWDDPYGSNGAAKSPICARANLLVISDTNVSYDSDQVPGADGQFTNSPFTGDLAGFHASGEAQTITNNEPGTLGKHFIGQSRAVFDSAPTAKEVTSLGSIRGLAPEEPTKQGSYYAAAAAYFGKRTDLRPDKDGVQNVETFVVALASPLPRIMVPVADGRSITLVPFAKSVFSDPENKKKGEFRPTNQIIDFYVEKIANSSGADADLQTNAGRYFAQFRISFEDTEQGADHDMDAVAQYTVSKNADNSVTVQVAPVYQAGGMRQSMGYVIAGTTADGVYLEVQDEVGVVSYFLHTPPGKLPGYCDKETLPGECAVALPHYRGPGNFDTATRIFTASSQPAATLLKDPLWYAAKWGGFKDSNGNDKPDLTSEWDADGDGIPDTYLPVVNPTKLRAVLRKTLDAIIARSSSASSLASNSNVLLEGTRVYQAQFESKQWSGDLRARKATAMTQSGPPEWKASEALPPWRERKIFIRTANGRVKDFSSDSLPGVRSEVLDFLRGDRSKEQQGGGLLRDRASGIGDIVHSSPLYDAGTDTVYVGANDGMLHAFQARDGREIFAMIPGAVINKLSDLANPFYTHQYLVDGDLALAQRSQLTGNQAFLYTLLGRGGKGLFSLNVSTPSTFKASDFLWEYSSASQSDGAADRDLGLMLGRPVITPLNNGKLGVVVGNGYNSTSGSAVLYVFIINADGSLAGVKKIDTGVANSNGLAAPAVLDTNRDGKADLVYAGDLWGNVWKFDISSTNPDDWRVSLDKKPLFQARSRAGAAQPITAPMTVTVNDRAGDLNLGKRFVFFGTGAYFRDQDPSDRSEQSWYGLIDEDTPIAIGRAALRERTIAVTQNNTGQWVRAFSLAQSGDMVNPKGWYIDLTSTNRGERMVGASKLLRLAVPALSAVSMYPEVNSCTGRAGGFENMVDPFTGGGLSVGVIDADGDRSFANDRINGLFIGSIELGVGLPSTSLVLRSGTAMAAHYAGSGDTRINAGGDTVGTRTVTINQGNPIARRIGWREIIRD